MEMICVQARANARRWQAGSLQTWNRSCRETGLTGRMRRLVSWPHPITRLGIAGLVRSMNSHHSNLIEGQRTNPRNIDAALTRDFSSKGEQRNLQLLHRARPEAQRLMAERLPGMAPAGICPAEFLCRLRQSFYERMTAKGAGFMNGTRMSPVILETSFAESAIQGAMMTI